MRAILCLLFSLMAGSLLAQDKPQDHQLTVHTFKQTTLDELRSDYLLFLPVEFEKKSEKRWPLILFLHGAGERGSNAWTTDIHGPAKYIADHLEFPFVMVSPQCPSNQVWSTRVLLALLDEVVNSYNVDTNRIYLTGLSMGGFGAWDLALAAPGRFAAVIPICGGGEDLIPDLARLGYTTPREKELLKTLPVWAFHGGKDTVVRPEESDRMIGALRDLGNTNANLTIYPEAQHNSWDQTYTNSQIYTWLLQHKNPRK
jgi:predicted peptidase